MHKMLEVYYGIKGRCAREDSETWKELLSAGAILWPYNDDTAIESALKGADYFATKMDLPFEEVAEVKYQFKEYCEYYKGEPWRPLAVEEVGSKVLF